jgi:Trk K+ transport system NAD-binding subunit
MTPGESESPDWARYLVRAQSRPSATQNWPFGRGTGNTLAIQVTDHSGGFARGLAAAAFIAARALEGLAAPGHWGI